MLHKYAQLIYFSSYISRIFPDFGYVRFWRVGSGEGVPLRLGCPSNWAFWYPHFNLRPKDQTSVLCKKTFSVEKCQKFRFITVIFLGYDTLVKGTPINTLHTLQQIGFRFWKFIWFYYTYPLERKIRKQRELHCWVCNLRVIYAHLLHKPNLCGAAADHDNYLWILILCSLVSHIKILMHGINRKSIELIFANIKIATSFQQSPLQASSRHNSQSDEADNKFTFSLYLSPLTYSGLACVRIMWTNLPWKEQPPAAPFVHQYFDKIKIILSGFV